MQRVYIPMINELGLLVMVHKDTKIQYTVRAVDTFLDIKTGKKGIVFRVWT